MSELNLGWVRIAFGRSPSRGEVGELDLIKGIRSYANPDDLVGRKGLETYSLMQKDGQVKACLAIKKASVLSRGYEIQPHERDGERGKEVAEFCSFALEEMQGSLLTVLWNVLDALAKGYSLQNIVWKVCTTGQYAGKWVPAFIKSKDPDDWSFDVDTYKNVVGVRYNPSNAVYPPDRFIIYTYQPDYSNPYGTPDIRACYRNWWSKDFLVRFWNLYLEKFGSPTVKGTFKRGTPKDAQEELLKVLASVRSESAIIVPEGVQAELLETIRQGDVGYRIAVDFHNKEIAKSILGITLITDDGGSGVGSFAMAKVHLDVLRMLCKGLKLDLEETVMREQVLRPLVRFNYGADVPVPRFSLGPLEDREFGPLTVGIKNLVDCGALDPADPVICELVRSWLPGAKPGPGKPEVSPTVTRTRDGAGGPSDGNNGRVQVN